MCDYSLEAYRSRPAQEGATYETQRFKSGSIGFVAPEDRSTAVCMACDMKLTLENLPEFVRDTNHVGTTETVTFVRIEPGPYRDGIRFENGREIRLQDLGTGVTAKVIDALKVKTDKPERVKEPA